MTFMITSDSFKDGDYLRSDFILSADYGFGCAGGDKSPHLGWSGAPAGTRSFAVTVYDPEAPTGIGLLALARGEHSRRCYGTRGGGGKPRRRLAGRRAADMHRLRGAGLRRTLSAYGRPSAPLSVLGLRREVREARRESGQLGRGGRVQLAFQHAGQDRDHGTV